MTTATRNLITLTTAMPTGHRMRRFMAASASTAAGVGPAVIAAGTGMAAMDGTAETDGTAAAVAGMAVDMADLTAAAALAAGEVRGAAAVAATEDMGIETATQNKNGVVISHNAVRKTFTA